MKKMVFKVLFGILLAILILVVTMCIIAWRIFGEQITAARSVMKLQDNLYTLEYRGDYGLDDFVEQGGVSDAAGVARFIMKFLSHGFYQASQEEVARAYGCDTIYGKTLDGQTVWGRNYDWQSCKTMIVHTVPEDGYESISTADLDFLGFGDDWTPEGMQNQMMALAAIYVPLDGMNEKGLVIADLMAGDQEETHQDTDKPDLTTTTAIRLILDRCATVDEALELLQQYDMNSDIGSAHHYSIADATGRSVVVEYVNGEMLVKDTVIVTNHYLTDSEKKNVGESESLDRFDKLMSRWQETEGVLETSDVCEMLQSVALKHNGYTDQETVWSIVYINSPEELSGEFYWEENYESFYQLKLQQGKNGKWIQ